MLRTTLEASHPLQRFRVACSLDLDLRRGFIDLSQVIDRQINVHRADILLQSLDTAGAGYRVGYDDASYFNRDYKKVYGEPPPRNVERLRELTLEGAV